MRKYGKRKRSVKGRRSYKRRRPTFVKRVKRIVNRMEESKFVTGYLGLTPTAATPTVSNVNAMAPGTARNTRLGNRISLTHLAVNFRASASANVLVGVNLRLVIFYDRQANSTALVPTTTLGGLFIDPTVANWYFALRDPNTMRRFRSIYDRTFRIEANLVTNVVAGATTTQSSYQVEKRIRIPLKGVITQYNDNGFGTIADIVSPVLYFALFTDATAGAGGVIVNTESMLKFKDA